MINTTNSNLPSAGVLPSSQSEADTLKISFLTELDDLLSSQPDVFTMGGFRLNLTTKKERLDQITSQYEKKGIKFDQLFHEYDFNTEMAGISLLIAISQKLQISCDPTDKTLIPKLFLSVAEQLDLGKNSEDLITKMRELIAHEKRYIEEQSVQVEAEAEPTESDLDEEEQSNHIIPVIQSSLLLSLGLVNTTLGITCGLQPGYLACVLGIHISLLGAIVAASAGMAMMGYGLYLSVFLNPEVQTADDSLSHELDGEESSAFDQLFGCYGAK